MSAGSQRPASVHALLTEADRALTAFNDELVTGAPPQPDDLALGWEAAQRSALHVLTALCAQDLDAQVVASPAAPVLHLLTGRPVPRRLQALGATAADAHRSPLHRLATSLGGAGDLLADGRIQVSAADARAAHLATEHLVLGTARGVAYAAVRDAAQLHISQFDVAQLDVAHQAIAVGRAAAHVVSTAETPDWSRTTLHDLALDPRPQPGPGDFPGLVEAVTYDWRAAALRAVADRAGGPSGDDLRRAARGARELLTMTLSLLRSEADRLTTNPSLNKRTPQWRNLMSTDHAASAALAAWTNATDVWVQHRTSTPGSMDLVQATEAVTSTVGSFARNGQQWKSPRELSQHPDHTRLLATTRHVSAAVHDVARRHAEVVHQLVGAGHVLARARSLPPLGAGVEDELWARETRADVELVRVRLRAISGNQWVRLTRPSESIVIRDAYRDLPKLTQDVQVGVQRLPALGTTSSLQDELAALRSAAFPSPASGRLASAPIARRAPDGVRLSQDSSLDR